MRKVLSLVLAISMVLGMFSFAFAGKLSDIEGEYYEAAVESLVELGVVNGYTDGTYKANQVVTRAELAKMLVVCLGQEQAAKIAKGSTQFTDVAPEHWASGYINVAAQSKIVVGYPDGTFAPEATVTYAEAVTMALRALGYKNVVEVSGTWPTNYITKANELQLLRDMKGVDAEDGAKRGNVAILLWNMLRTEMWAIDSENQTNGMTYKKTDFMINVKFPDYTYIEDARVYDVEVDGNKVNVSLSFTSVDPDTGREFPDALTAELQKGDVLKLYGRTVTALYDKKDKSFLVVTPTDEADVVEGKVVDVAGGERKIGTKTYKFAKDPYDTMIYNGGLDYALLVLDGGKIIAANEYVTKNYYVEKVKTVDDEVRINGSKLVLDDDSLVLFEGEPIDAKDIKEGDVITEFKLELDGYDNGTLYVVTRKTVEGELTKYVVGSDTLYNSDVVTLDGEKYYVSATAVLYEEDEDKGSIADIDDVDYLKALKGKEATLALDYFGEVVRISVGEVNPDASSKGIYLAISEGEYGAQWKTSGEDGTVWYIKLMDEKGNKEKYEINTKYEAEIDYIEQGELAYVKFDSKDRVKFLQVIHDGWDNGETSADKRLDGYTINGAELDGKKIADRKVDDDVVVFSVYTTENDDDEEELVMNVKSGRSELKGLDGENILVITGKYDVIKYVVLGGELGQKDLLFGTIKNVTNDIERNKLDRVEVVFGGKGKAIVVAEDCEDDVEDLQLDVDGVIVAYKLNGKDELVLKAVISPKDLEAYDTPTGHGYVTSASGKDAEAIINGAEEAIHLDDEDYQVPGTGKKLSKYKFMLVEVDETADGYEFSDYEEVDLEDLTFKKYDRLSVGKGELADYIFVIRGMDERD